MTFKYQIYGIGNALVDFEIETTPEELEALNVEKGVMTLIEEERQEALLQSFDGTRHSRASGGSAANTIMGAQLLGAKCFYSCKVANDDTGHFYRDDLLSKGVASNLSNEALAEGKTGKCLVMITDDADRTMNTFLGITGDVEVDQVNFDELAQSEYLYVEGYLASSNTAVETVRQSREVAKKHGIKTAFSLSDPNMIKFCREGLENIIGEGVDLLFCNYDEATQFTHTDNLNSAIKALEKIAKLVVVTLGAKGSVIAENGNQITINGHPVEAVDTNGAGDLFAGSFLYGITAGYSLQKAGELASYASSQLVTQFGPRLKEATLEKVKAFDQGLN